MRQPSLFGQMQGELVGSFLLVFFGTGSVAVAVLTGAHEGLWQVATVWGFAIGLTIYAVGAVSGAHLNPAVSVAMAVFRGHEFPWRRVGPYVAAQMVGGILASLLLLGMFGATCEHFETQHQLVRGQPGSQLSAMWFGEYFPNPAVYGTDATALSQVSVVGGFFGELVGTALLLFFIMALTDKCNKLAPLETNFHPFLIGFVVACIISIVAPLTQAGLNPMRDFAPRLVSYFAGWGAIALPGPRGCEWWVYIVAPLLGGILGAFVYQTLVLPHQTGERIAAGGERSECALFQPGMEGLGCCPPGRTSTTPSLADEAPVPNGGPPVQVVAYIRLFLADPGNPSGPALAALSRAEAAARRFGGRVGVRLLPLDCAEAQELGAAVEPTVAVGDLVLAAGQPPLAGHLVRALEAAVKEGSA